MSKKVYIFSDQKKEENASLDSHMLPSDKWATH